MHERWIVNTNNKKKMGYLTGYTERNIRGAQWGDTLNDLKKRELITIRDGQWKRSHPQIKTGRNISFVTV